MSKANEAQLITKQERDADSMAKEEREKAFLGKVSRTADFAKGKLRSQAGFVQSYIYTRPTYSDNLGERGGKAVLHYGTRAALNSLLLVANTAQAAAKGAVGAKRLIRGLRNDKADYLEFKARAITTTKEHTPEEKKAIAKQNTGKALKVAGSAAQKSAQAAAAATGKAAKAAFRTVKNFQGGEESFSEANRQMASLQFLKPKPSGTLAEAHKPISQVFKAIMHLVSIIAGPIVSVLIKLVLISIMVITLSINFYSVFSAVGIAENAVHISQAYKRITLRDAQFSQSIRKSGDALTINGIQADASTYLAQTNAECALAYIYCKSDSFKEPFVANALIDELHESLYSLDAQAANAETKSVSDYLEQHPEIMSERQWESYKELIEQGMFSRSAYLQRPLGEKSTYVTRRYGYHLDKGNSIALYDNIEIYSRPDDEVFSMADGIVGIVSPNSAALHIKGYAIEYKGLKSVCVSRGDHIKAGDLLGLAQGEFIQISMVDTASEYLSDYLLANEIPIDGASPLVGYNLMADGTPLDSAGTIDYKALTSNKSVNAAFYIDGLYNAGTGSAAIVATAQSQIGNNGDIYKKWFYHGENYGEWCVMFIAWCAEQNAMIEAGIIPRLSGTKLMKDWYDDIGLYIVDKSYIPQPGDIIFIDWDEKNIPGHVGLVVSVEGDRVITIEGNSGGTNAYDSLVRQKSYPLSSAVITGYGHPEYPAPNNAEIIGNGSLFDPIGPDSEPNETARLDEEID
ncbi:MAG: CHAP domain-containing protein [Eubacteriaceae bacterium]|nr:CHAP domain-containing protein [Eubacteriaceae bacterium]